MVLASSGQEARDAAEKIIWPQMVTVWSLRSPTLICVDMYKYSVFVGLSDANPSG